MRHRNAARAEIGRALALTDDQRRVILEKARAAEPIVAQWRRDLAREFVARETTPQADRTARRAAHRALREKLAADLAPLAKEVVATLTPEQRARLEGFAAARGRKLTDDALVAFVSRMLARPMTVPLLEARLGTR